MKKILIIEDNLEIRENTSEILELTGYHVISASNGEEGVMRANKEKPDMILCDIMMSGVDGYEVLRQLKSNSATATIPFIYLTASVERTEIDKALELGANDYIRKPYETSDLLRVIATNLRRN